MKAVKINYSTYIPLLLFLLAIITRFAFIEQYQSHWDGPQFSMAVIHFDLLQDKPTPPGYPLYVFLGKLVYPFLLDPHLSLIVVGILTTGFGAMLYFQVGKKLFNESVGIISSLLYLSGATFYFLSLTAHGYVMVPVTTLLFAYLSYLSLYEKKKIEIGVGLAFSFAVGIRPQELPFLLPLLILTFFTNFGRQSFYLLLSSFAGIVLWLIPTAATVGGILNYYRITSAFGESAITGSNIFTNFHEHILIMMKGFFLSFSASLLFLGYYLYLFIFQTKHNWKELLMDKRLHFWIAWIVPALLFNLFIRSDQAGHQMAYLSGLVLLIAYAIYEVCKKKQYLLPSVVVVLILINLYTFFRDRDPHFSKPYIPTSFHYSEIRKNDIKLGSKVRFIESHFSSETTLIITSELLWRPYMYHLRGYHLVALSGLDITDPNVTFREYTGYNWIQEEIANTSRTVAFPKGTTRLIFMDDQASEWIKSNEIKTVKLPGKSMLSAVKVSDKEKISYAYHSVRISK